MAGFITNDIEAFIGSIKKRPALYVKSLKEYTDVNYKKQLWDEVCMEVVSGWAELYAGNKRKIGADVQKKWMNLRTCFSRELKAQRTKSGPAASKRRKYIYFENLMFLKPCLSRRRTENNTNDYDGEEESEFMESNEDYVPPPPTQQSYQQKPVNANETFQQSNNLKEELDEDKNFALSLVHTLKSFTEDEKFEAKIEILKLFRRIKNDRLTAQSNTRNNLIQQPTGSEAGPSLENQISRTQRPSPSSTPNSVDSEQSYCMKCSPSATSDIIDIKIE